MEVEDIVTKVRTQILETKSVTLRGTTFMVKHDQVGPTGMPIIRTKGTINGKRFSFSVQARSGFDIGPNSPNLLYVICVLEDLSLYDGMHSKKMDTLEEALEFAEQILKEDE